MYEINFKNLAVGLLPQSLRGNVVELMHVLTHPFRVLHHRFMSYRAEKLDQLHYSCCVGSLQAMLNDYFADNIVLQAAGLPILVCEGDIIQETYIYPEAEHLPLMIGCVNIYPLDVWGVYPFVIRVPRVFEENRDMMHKIIRLANQYKLTGTTYRIEYYE